MPTDALSQGKLRAVVAFAKKLHKHFKPFGLSDTDFDELFHKEFLIPLIKIDTRKKTKTLKAFKAIAKELYDDVIEEEEEDYGDEED